jgi:Plavaka transposase
VIYALLTDAQPFTADFPRADIHEMISPDLLHQFIKGGFKDHLVTWVCEYLTLTYGDSQAKKILDDIDRRYVKNSLFTLVSGSLAAHIPTKNRCCATIPWSSPLSTWSSLQAVDRGRF